MKESLRTLVLGASVNSSRYSNMATRRLFEAGHDPIPLGRNTGEIAGIPILTGKPKLNDVHTITMYLNPLNQKPMYEYILGLKPKRIIFNPGSENDELAQKAESQGIIVENACTLVMLSLGSFVG